ncbi:patatin-like phospholipase family protein [Pontiellaceae bacterium B12219]|nr:patatin-like phospholipase family protein [Pontiellaceae bacterium B12219]
MKKIGLALGGGGAKGFAHIPILEVFDELGIKPHCITGTSIGGILGALYAANHSALDIAEMINDLLVKPQKSSLKDFFRNKDLFKFLQLMDPQLSLKPKGLLKGDKLLGFLYEQLEIDSFEKLSIPLKVVATDFWRKEQVVIDKGELLTALRATMAIPYVFTPVIIDDRVLVDGGLVNIVPHDLLDTDCDIRIAVDIMGNSTVSKTKIPSPLDAMFNTVDVLQDALATEKRANHPVDIYLQPPITDIQMIDFHKAELIYKQALLAKDDFKRQLEKMLEEKSGDRHWFRRKR